MVLSQFLLDISRAVAIWTGLLLLATVAMAVLIARTRRSEPADRAGADRAAADRLAATAGRWLAGTTSRWLTETVGRVRQRLLRRSHRAEWARDAVRYADEVAVAADRAARTARRRHDDWLAVQNQVDAAWRTFDAADLAVRRIAAAAALPVPTTARTPIEYADRERYLHRAAMAAYWRRELSVGQLTDALASRNGWDPRRHPVEQELVLRAVIRDRRYAEYRAASAWERDAWQAAEVARAAAWSLRTEAAAATAEAHRMRRWLPRAAAKATRDAAAVGGDATMAVVTLPIAAPAGSGWNPVRAGG
ncbi:hypothetical protein O7632_12785 [Solwaraspora sp. WMMD406]|uniref:hypothetical protein n=1 Tax=Solwaraspora sp. WMMD406 TaxID=3016095 RepID=UPI002415ABCD|nr:hypothetical protein [Solwaraspora sp. WMMD406]MDG4764967.1 hypothetical protein [Solwaraspora sp. WMMD406]